MKTSARGIFLSCLIFGCTTPYQQRGLGGGYESRMLEFGHYEISVAVNAYTPAVAAVEYFHHRARELCAGPYSVETLWVPGAPQVVANAAATVYNDNRQQRSAAEGAGYAAGVAVGSLIRAGRTDKQVYGQVRCQTAQASPGELQTDLLNQAMTQMFQGASPEELNAFSAAVQHQAPDLVNKPFSTWTTADAQRIQTIALAVRKAFRGY